MLLANTPESEFGWGWSCAFQQVGDPTVECLSPIYRLAGWSFVLPATTQQRVSNGWPNQTRRSRSNDLTNPLTRSVQHVADPYTCKHA